MRRNLGRRSNCAAFPDIAQGTKVRWSLNLEPSASAWRRLRRIRSLCICSSFKMTRRHHILIYTRQLEKYPVVAMRRIFVDFLAGAASLSKNLGRHKQPRSPVAILIGMVGRLAKSTVESPAAVLQCPGMKTRAVFRSTLSSSVQHRLKATSPILFPLLSRCNKGTFQPTNGRRFVEPIVRQRVL